MKMFSSVYFIISIPSVSRKIKYPAAADFIFLLTLGMEIMKYTLENIFHFEVRVLKKIIYI
jgi:hypothetical protein